MSNNPSNKSNNDIHTHFIYVKPSAKLVNAHLDAAGWIRCMVGGKDQAQTQAEIDDSFKTLRKLDRIKKPYENDEDYEFIIPYDDVIQSMKVLREHLKELMADLQLILKFEAGTMRVVSKEDGDNDGSNGHGGNVFAIWLFGDRVSDGDVVSSDIKGSSFPQLVPLLWQTVYNNSVGSVL